MIDYCPRCGCRLTLRIQTTFGGYGHYLAKMCDCGYSKRLGTCYTTFESALEALRLFRVRVRR